MDLRKSMMGCEARNKARKKRIELARLATDVLGESIYPDAIEHQVSEYRKLHPQKARELARKLETLASIIRAS